MKTATITIGKAIGFVARKAIADCKNCLFMDHSYEVCKRVEAVARQAGLPDCEDGDGFIYVEADPRQLVLDEEVLP